MRLYVLIIALFPISLYCDKRVCTLIVPHSPSTNAARELAGWENRVNIHPSDAWHGAFSITPEITTSFRPERIAQCFFGDSIIKCKNRLTIAGSQSPDRADMYWLADYFGLPTDYKGIVSFCPIINQAILDLDLQVEFAQFAPGLYLRIHAPLVYSKWDLGFCQELITTGTNGYDAGYFTSSPISRTQLNETFQAFISGKDTVRAAGLSFEKLKYGLMDYGSQHLVKLSDVQIAIGYNILHNPRYHVGGNLRVSIPTGNSPTGRYLFEPIIGNGHHWELGGGLSTHIILWEQPETEEKAGLYFDINIMHMFKTIQCRSFDICGSHNSRYMLAEKMSRTITNNLRGSVDGALVIPSAQYNSVVSSIVNLTTFPVEVSASVQADLAIMFSYQKAKNSWGFGYSFWARSCENISLCKLIPFESELWAIKGDASVFGFENDGFYTPIALSATQSKATIHHGKNFVKTGATTQSLIESGQENKHIDNPELALSDSNNDGTFNQVYTMPYGSLPIRTSIEPELLSRASIDIYSARTRGRSHKIFSHFSHTIFLQNSTPYIGFGAEIEFGQQGKCTPEECAGEPPCINTAVSQWGAWLKGGIAF